MMQKMYRTRLRKLNNAKGEQHEVSRYLEMFNFEMKMKRHKG